VLPSKCSYLPVRHRPVWPCPCLYLLVGTDTGASVPVSVSVVDNGREDVTERSSRIGNNRLFGAFGAFVEQIWDDRLGRRRELVWDDRIGDFNQYLRPCAHEGC
jgi:hypothetical protein